MNYQGTANDREAFITFKNVMRMMEARGYEIDDFVVELEDGEIINVLDVNDLDTFAYDYVIRNNAAKKDPNEFNVYEILKTIVQPMSFRTSMSTYFFRPDKERKKPGNICVVYFAAPSEKEIPKSEISIFSSLIIEANIKSSYQRDNDCLEYMFVSKNPLNGPAKKELETISSGEFIQDWIDIDLAFNPLNNKRGARAVLKTIEETKQILGTMELEPNQIPSQAINDKISKYLGARPGQMVYNYRNVILPGPTAKRSLYPRIVTNKIIPDKLKKKKQ